MGSNMRQGEVGEKCLSCKRREALQLSLGLVTAVTNLNFLRYLVFVAIFHRDIDELTINL